MSANVILPDTIPEVSYVKVTDGQGGPTIGVAKVYPQGGDVIADIRLFPECCPEHGTVTKVRASLGREFPQEAFS